MYCERCGYKLRRGVKSCAQCGAQTPYNRSRSAVLIIAAVLLTIAGFAMVIIADNGNEMPVIIVDILAVAAILIGLFVGVRRGFLYGTLSTVLLAVVFSVSIFISRTVSPLIYDGLIRSSIVDSVNNAVSDSSPSQHLVDAIGDVMSRDDSMDVLIDYLNDELTGSRKVTSAVAYIQLTGIENTESNKTLAELYMNGSLTGTDSSGNSYDYRKKFAYALAESWLTKCLPEYDSFDDFCDMLTTLLNSSGNVYTEMRIASEIRETVKSDVLVMVIGNDFFTSENIMNCIEYVIGEEAADEAVDSIVWGYLTGNNVGETVESRIFEPLIVYCLEVILCMVLVLLLRFLMSLVMRVFKFLEGIHIPYVLDVISGAVEGIAGGAAWVCYAGALVGIAVILIMLFGSDFDATVTETIENTAVFGYFFRLVGHLGI